MWFGCEGGIEHKVWLTQSCRRHLSSSGSRRRRRELTGGAATLFISDNHHIAQSSSFTRRSTTNKNTSNSPRRPQRGGERKRNERRRWALSYSLHLNIRNVRNLKWRYGNYYVCLGYIVIVISQKWNELKYFNNNNNIESKNKIEKEKQK